MGKVVKLQASDSHLLDAYVAEPDGKPWGGLVVVQEIFGVNQHIRSVTDRFAQEGFFSVAPALFDRVEPHVELTDAGDGMQKAIALAQKINIEDAVKDVEAALQYAAKRPENPLLWWVTATAAHWPGWLQPACLRPLLWDTTVAKSAGLLRRPRKSPSCSTSASRTSTFRKPMSRKCRRRIRRWKLTGITRDTHSTTTRAPAMTKKHRRKPWPGRSSFSTGIFDLPRPEMAS